MKNLFIDCVVLGLTLVFIDGFINLFTLVVNHSFILWGTDLVINCFIAGFTLLLSYSVINSVADLKQ